MPEWIKNIYKIHLNMRLDFDCVVVKWADKNHPYFIMKGALIGVPMQKMIDRMNNDV